MSAVPVRCLHCQQDLRYDPIGLRYRCPACEEDETTRPRLDPWREGGRAVGRGLARLLRHVEQWLRK